MAGSRQISLKFPLGGLHRALDYQGQPPYTTPDCLNVRPVDPVTGRTRGGSRPGLSKAYADPLVADKSVNMLASVRASNTQASWRDEFDTGTVSSSAWTAISGRDALTVSEVGGYASCLSTVDQSSVAWRAFPATMDPDEFYSVEIRICALPLAHCDIILCMDDADPDWGEDSVVLSAGFSESVSTVAFNAATYVAGEVTTVALLPEATTYGHWYTMRAEVWPNGTIHLYWDNEEIHERNLPVSPAGNRVGLTAYTTSAYGSLPKIDYCLIQWVSTVSTVQPILCAGCNGKFFRTGPDGVMDEPATTVAVPKTTRFRAVERSGKLYIAAATPLVFDPTGDALATWAATDGGTVPPKCSLIARYRDRLVLAGDSDNPQQWYMSRQGDPLAWAFTGAVTDAGRPVSGTVSDAGAMGGPITAIVAGSLSYLLMATSDSLWRMSGDPAYGGRMDNLSRTIGIVDADAWCWGPQNEILFLSRDGLYLLGPDAASFPQSFSREVLPRELVNVRPEQDHVSMAYDIHGRGVHVCVTPLDGSLGRSWWIDWTSKTFWPVEVPVDQQSHALLSYPGTVIRDSIILVGGQDGYIRRFSDLAPSDDGTEISSYVDYGPFLLGGNEYYEGLLERLDAIVGEDSGGVDWALRVGDTAEEAFAATACETGTWTAGRNATSHPRRRGVVAYLRLSNAAATPWVIGQIDAFLRAAGRARIA